jgi:hypothetical protein
MHLLQDRVTDAAELPITDDDLTFGWAKGPTQSQGDCARTLPMPNGCPKH